MDKYYILMGDIKDSRKYNSDYLSQTLQKVMNNAEKKFYNSLLTKLEIKVGDDFQVVTKDIKTVLSILLYLDISFVLENIECRFAIGYGSISGKMNKCEHSKIMGIGLTNTNEVLNKKDKKYSFYVQNDIYKTVLLDTIGMLLEKVFNSFTDKQKEFLYYKVIEGKDLKEIQLVMNVKERAVYYYSERSKYMFVENVFEQIILSFEKDSEKLFNYYYKDINIDEKNYEK